MILVTLSLGKPILPCPPVSFDAWSIIKQQKTVIYPVEFKFKPPVPCQQVYLAGSFNGWNPAKDKMAGPDKAGYWTLHMNLAEGTYFYKFVIDGKQWFSDPENPEKADDGQKGYNSIKRAGHGWGINAKTSRGDGKILNEGLFFAPALPYLEKINDTTLRFRFDTHRSDVQKASLLMVKMNGGEASLQEYPIPHQYTSSHSDHYQVLLPISESSCGFFFKIQDHHNTLYWDINGITDNYARVSAYPLIISELPYKYVPQWAQKAVWYQIFPERFRNGDKNNDPLGEKTPPWTWDWFKPLPWENGNFYPNIYLRFYGGDLQGILEKLPYLETLGITALYLNPVFVSPSIHGYDTQDYRHINPHFGYLADTTPPAGETLDPKTWSFTSTDQLFLKLVKECHKRNMKIILDGVFNHTGDQFWAFKDVQEKGNKSAYKDWYKILDFGPPLKYQGWWGSQQLPEIKQDESGIVPGFRQHILDITRRWMDPDGDGNPSDGIDGWRLDAAELVSPVFWRDWCAYVRQINPEAITIGELWDKSSEWTGPGMFDAVMNYEFTKRLYRFFVDTHPPYKTNAEEFAESLQELLGWYSWNTNYAMQNLLDSHDTERIVSGLMNPNRAFDQGNRLQDKGNDAYYWGKPSPEAYQRLKLIVLFQMTFPGCPMIFYGDEAGMWGADDPSDRKPMLWQDLEPYDNPDDKVNETLLDFYHKLILLRKAYPALQTGDYTLIKADNTRNSIIYSRNDDKDRFFIILNNSAHSQTLKFKPGTSNGCRYHKIFGVGKDSYRVINNSITLSLPPFYGLIIKELRKSGEKGQK
jgi:glycosidase